MKSWDPLKGRGALSSPDNRFDALQREQFDDGWEYESQIPDQRTVLIEDNSKTIINANDSPDVPFAVSINPYRGCEHGCVYCFARPTHAYLGFSPGLEFETKLTYKPEAAKLLRQALAKKNYRCQPITLGINTDAYQPIERKLKITRQIVEVFYETQHPFTVVTKSALVERDLDLLVPMAQRNLAHIVVSVTTLDRELARKLEPRAAAPQRRLALIRTLRDAGIAASVLVAPIIPVLTEYELEKILTAVHEAGAMDADYVLMRLPHETKQLMEEWLTEHYPLKAKHVLERIKDCHGGKLYDSNFGQRMTGSGPYAQLINQRFYAMKKRLGFCGVPQLDTTQFRRPTQLGDQLALF